MKRTLTAAIVLTALTASATTSALAGSYNDSVRIQQKMDTIANQAIRFEMKRNYR